MSGLWFTADTHFGHENIVKHCGRPFSSVEDMDYTILSNLNEEVGERDELWHLGDFAWTGLWREYRDEIACQRIHLVLGNHDPGKEGRRALREGLFESVSEYVRLKCHGAKMVLCHFPIESWRPGYVHLHGHSHGNSISRPGRIDVGIDARNFRPVPFSEVSTIAAPMFEYRHGGGGA